MTHAREGIQQEIVLLGQHIQSQIQHENNFEPHELMTRPRYNSNYKFIFNNKETTNEILN